MEMLPASDCAADLLEPNSEWIAYLQAMSGFLTGAGLERISVADYIAYDAASTGCNWRAQAGYGSLVAASLPRPIDLRLLTPVESIELDSRAVVLATPVGPVRTRTRAVILTVSTAVLAGGTITLPHEFDPWRHAAARLPLGRNEKLFLEITGDSPFVPETRVLGNPPDRRTGVYYIRPFGWPVIECFLGVGWLRNWVQQPASHAIASCDSDHGARTIFPAYAPARAAGSCASGCAVHVLRTQQRTNHSKASSFVSSYPYQ